MRSLRIAMSVTGHHSAKCSPVRHRQVPTARVGPRFRQLMQDFSGHRDSRVIACDGEVQGFYDLSARM